LVSVGTTKKVKIDSKKKRLEVKKGKREMKGKRLHYS
jgi:hypothetical protein